MSKTVRLVWTITQLLALTIFAALLAILRFFYETPQPLESVLPGADRLYKWTFGHVFYKVIGDENNPPLVLLHAPGIGNSSYEMRAIMHDLARHYRVYALDLLGFGLSDRPTISYTGDLYVQLCRDFLTDVVARPATLLASGLSCNYAVAVAESAGSAGSTGSSSLLCERLVLLSPLSLFEYKQPSIWLTQVLQNRALGITLYASLTTRFVLRYVVGWQHRLDYKHISKEDLDAVFANAHQFGAQHASLAQITGKLYVGSKSNAAIQQPALIIWGVHALSGMRASINQHAISSRTQVILIQDAGVQVHEEAPEKVVTNILEWATEENAQVLVKVESTVATNASALPAQMNSPEVVQSSTQEQADPIAVAPGEDSSVHEIVAENSASSIEEKAATDDVEAYCVKCRQKRVIQGAHRVMTKNGRSALEGTCPVCGTRLFRFVAR